MKTIITHLIVCLLLAAYTGTSTARADDLYFPPAEGEWETVAPADVGWDQAAIQNALDFAGAQNSTGVVILHRGRIMAEQFWELTGPGSEKFNQRLVGRDAAGHGIEDVASAQKSITSFLVGVAREKGLLKIDDPVSKYLGEGWSRATPEQERAITIRHLITMTSGLTERGGYEAEPGTKWLYNTAVYSRTMKVLTAASGMDLQELTAAWLTRRIGMTDSRWAERGGAARAVNAYGFATTARDLARFGLLMLARGKWGDQVILGDGEYLKASTTTSQDMNPYYGYLWWVSRNAHAPDRAPQPAAAPADMYAAKGALTRRCYVVPSLELVVTRLGDQPLAGRMFDRRFWGLLMEGAPE
jgi:CubicO group peptidase (beta-lactamase class C family)